MAFSYASLIAASLPALLLGTNSFMASTTDSAPTTAPPEKPAPAAPAPQGAVDQYIANLVTGGTVDSGGEFTLDRETARRKMAQFQFREPEEFALSLVRAAVLKGASAIEVETDEHTLRMSFDGRGFSAAEFDDLYGSLFAATANADRRACRQLALAINAAIGGGASLTRVSSRSGSGVAVLECRPGAGDVFGSGDDAEKRTSIRVDLGRFFDDRDGERRRPRLRDLRERIEQDCGWCRIPVRLDGRVVSHGLELPDALGSAPVEGPGFRGVAGFLPDEHERGLAYWIVDGVRVAREPLERVPDGLLVVVDGSEILRLDASQSKVVHDAAVGSVMQAIDRAVLPAMVSAGGELRKRRDSPALHARLRELARAVLAGHTLDELMPGGSEELLGRLSAFATVDGTGTTVQDLARLAERHGVVLWADRTLAALAGPPDTIFQGQLAERNNAFFRGHDIVHLSWVGDPRERALLYRLFGDRLRFVGRALLRIPRDPDLLVELVRNPGSLWPA